MSLGIESPKVLHEAEAAVLFSHNKYWAVEFAASGLHNTEFKPFSDMLFHLFTMGIRDFKLFDVDRFFTAECHVMHQGGRLAEVVLVRANSFMVLEQHI